MINAIIQQGMGLVQYGIDRRCATLPASQQWPGAEHTTSEAVATPTESGVLLCPNSGAGRGLSMAMLCGFGLGASVRKAGGTASDVCSTPSPSYAIEHADDGFSTPEGAETMTTVETHNHADRQHHSPCTALHLARSYTGPTSLQRRQLFAQPLDRGRAGRVGTRPSSPP